MSIFSFKKEANGYVVFADNQYNITLSEVSFSQGISTNEISRKTLHEPESQFPKVILDKFAPAVFQIGIYAIREDDFVVLFQRALDCLTFDFYVQTRQDTFKIENCVITSMALLLNKAQAVGINYTGGATKISRVGDGTYTIPGTEVPRASTHTYNRLNYSGVQLGTTVYTNLTEIIVELQNKINWTPNDKIGKCADPRTPGYSESFTVDGKVLAGTFTTYAITEPTRSQSESLQILVGENDSGTVYGFSIDIDSVSYTSRINTGSVFTQSYDWRMTQNPDSLNEIIDYVVYPPGAAGAILDHLNDPILDWEGNPILESV